MCIIRVKFEKASGVFKLQHYYMQRGKWVHMLSNGKMVVKQNSQV